MKRLQWSETMNTKTKPEDVIVKILNRTVRYRSEGELAEEFLELFQDIDRAQLLKEILVLSLYKFRFGNKREERDAFNILKQFVNLGNQVTDKFPVKP